MKNILLVFLIFQSFIYCKSQSDNQIRTYFNSVCKNTEYHGKLSEPKKWETDVKIFVKGKKVDYLNNELIKIVSGYKKFFIIIEPRFISGWFCYP